MNDEIIRMVDALARPVAKPRGTATRKIAVTVYDEAILEAIQSWAAASGTNMSSVIYHCLNQAAYTLQQYARQHPTAEEPTQQLITQHTPAPSDVKQAPRLDDPTAVWMEYLADCKDVDTYQQEVETHLRKILKLCNSKYEELNPAHV